MLESTPPLPLKLLIVPTLACKHPCCYIPYNCKHQDDAAEKIASALCQGVTYNLCHLQASAEALCIYALVLNAIVNYGMTQQLIIVGISTK